MDVFVWVMTGLLAVAFLGAGAMKVARPKEALAEAGMAWTEEFSPGSIKTIGGLELLAGLGLILPAVTGIAPALVGWAAVGLCLVMIGAAVVHLRRGEPALAAVNVALLALAAFVAWAQLGSDLLT